MNYQVNTQAEVTEKRSRRFPSKHVEFMLFKCWAIDSTSLVFWCSVRTYSTAWNPTANMETVQGQIQGSTNPPFFGDRKLVFDMLSYEKIWANTTHLKLWIAAARHNFKWAKNFFLMKRVKGEFAIHCYATVLSLNYVCVLYYYSYFNKSWTYCISLTLHILFWHTTVATGFLQTLAIIGVKT